MIPVEPSIIIVLCLLALPGSQNHGSLEDLRVLDQVIGVSNGVAFRVDVAIIVDALCSDRARMRWLHAEHTVTDGSLCMLSSCSDSEDLWAWLSGMLSLMLSVQKVLLSLQDPSFFVCCNTFLSSD